MCEHSFLQGHSGEKVLLRSGWILHLISWGTNYNTLKCICRQFCPKEMFKTRPSSNPRGIIRAAK